VLSDLVETISYAKYVLDQCCGQDVSTRNRAKALQSQNSRTEGPWAVLNRRHFWGLSVVGRMGEKRNVYRLLVGNPEGKRPLRRPRRRWMDNIKMDLLEIGLNVVDWIGLAQDR
jgi:hypothetical protein